MSRYVLALAAEGLLPVPLTVTHAPPGVAPDFMIVSKETIGVELTEATTTEFHEELIRNEQSLTGFHCEQSVPDLGWAGDAPEQKWAELVLKTIRDKAEKLAKGHFEVAENQDLLIYIGNAPMPAEEDKALALFRNALSSEQGTTVRGGFRQVSLINDRRLFFDVIGKLKIIDHTLGGLPRRHPAR